MSLVIAVVFVMIVLLGKLNNSVTKTANKMEIKAKQRLEQAFMDEYTDRDFEYQVLSFIQNPQYREQVNQEVKKALSEMQYQKREYYNLPIEDIQDILLANRGKVRGLAATSGYKVKKYRKVKGGSVRDFDGELEQYGFMVWLQNTLRKQGKKAELVVMKTYADIPYGYAWIGSPKERGYNSRNDIRTGLNDYNPQTHWANQPIEPVI